MVAELNAIEDGEGRIREKLSYVSGKMEKGISASSLLLSSLELSDTNVYEL